MLAKNKAKKHIKIYEEIQGYIEEINTIDGFMNIIRKEEADDDKAIKGEAVDDNSFRERIRGFG